MAEPIRRYQLEGVDSAPDVEITWTHEDQAAALAEGWYLDELDGAIQADQEADAFVFDVQAFNHIKEQATAGSELHLKAMILDAWAALGAWEMRFREATGQTRDW
ncbi:hypothetical protein [Methylobacterium dankookense]|uniref:Uncharacterized protein n=1 Tax=Methylobacterium dankookense TaxID=560405 RepID=A0A564G5G6_9HYPH|nr:hypothetical protein [Methylobacterium dankookense]GJD58691.1 hypothetical protein IFDJLNFL_4614 [Methylobacterium dankookense]VUF15180.1 hypothetical protein MTDSW087_04915 [Methylobacterium dankookense]